MGKRNWEPRLFATAFVMVGLWAALRAVFAPFYRVRSKLGSWEQAWQIVAQAPGLWFVAVLVRALVGAFLLWLILHLRRRSPTASYFGVAIAAFVIPAADIVLSAGLGLG